MANYAMMIDFGSTYTKIVCASLTEKRLIRAGSFPSTVRSDARVNLEQCMEFARETLGKENLEQSLKLCSSSAAGGLRMAVIGLTERLSYVAGRNTAFGAGGKIIASYSGALTPEQIHELELSQAEIILLCGGYERGNRSIVMHNAEMLANSHIFIPVIYAGNSSIAPQVRTALVSREKKCLLADNIIPDVGVLNTASAEEAIRDQFMNRIVNMKGIGCVRSELGEVLMPTPAAVLAAGTLLSEGIGNTIRVSLTADPVREVSTGIAIVRAAGLRPGGVRFVSCPTCGRTEIDLISLATEVENRVRDMKRDITVAVMGCVVNGPGEAREADYGIAGGKGKGLLFKKGVVLGTYPYDRLCDALIDLINTDEDK